MRYLTNSSGAPILNASGNPIVKSHDLALTRGLKIWHSARLESFTENQLVATVSDFSGNSNAPTQATDANKPIFRTGLQNDYPAFEFSSNQFANYPSKAVFNNIGGQTQVFVFKKKATSATSQYLFLFSHNTNTLQARVAFIPYFQSSNSVLFTSKELDTDTAASLTTGADNNIHIAIFTANFTTNTMKMWLDGTVVATGSTIGAGGVTSNTNSQTARLGAGNTSAGSGGSPDLYYNGYMFESLICTNSLTDSEVDEVYFKLKAIYRL